MRGEYELDYSRAEPNRFAAHMNRRSSRSYSNRTWPRCSTPPRRSTRSSGQSCRRACSGNSRREYEGIAARQDNGNWRRRQNAITSAAVTSFVSMSCRCSWAPASISSTTPALSAYSLEKLDVREVGPRTSLRFRIKQQMVLLSASPRRPGHSRSAERRSSGSARPASANPLARSTQLSQRLHGRPSGAGS